MTYSVLTLRVIFAIVMTSWATGNIYWLKKDCKSFTLNYTTKDTSLIDEYQQLIAIGLKNVERFFDDRYKNKFDVFIYPDRKSLDSTRRNDWKVSDFKSECWMVASGVSKKIDILSPKIWDAESCEHKYDQKEQTQQLITHELVHVFHGQLNVSPDFSDVKNIDWFIEGLATYASGQCDSNRVMEVIKAIKSETIPRSVDQFWTGKLKYALSATMVMYIDKKYGRIKIKHLLTFHEEQEILQALGITEIKLLSGWKEYMLSPGAR